MTMWAMDAIRTALGTGWQLHRLNASSFCQTFTATHGTTKLFVKHGNPAMLEAEADGLRALAATDTIRVPRIVHSEHGILALEWLDLHPPDAGFGARFGLALAQLHSHPADHYGWPRDNFIGATPQANSPANDWLTFFAEQRLRAMAHRLDGRVDAIIDRVIEAMPRLFDDGYAPRPSLIHGDLWSGNWGMLADGTPVIYDPVVSHSDAEAELAMMELFGSPPSGFWQAYRDAARLHAGYGKRRSLYQLYHLLNHAVLFGGGYEQQARDVASQVLAAAA